MTGMMIYLVKIQSTATLYAYTNFKISNKYLRRAFSPMIHAVIRHTRQCIYGKTKTTCDFRKAMEKLC